MSGERHRRCGAERKFCNGYGSRAVCNIVKRDRMLTDFVSDLVGLRALHGVRRSTEKPSTTICNVFAAVGLD